MTAGKAARIVTGTATLCVFDPALLRHKLDDDCDWWSIAPGYVSMRAMPAPCRRSRNRLLPWIFFACFFASAACVAI